MHLSDFDFHLPEELIALRPVKPRPASRLLRVNGSLLEDRHVHELPQLLRPGDMLVFNNTKVLPTRLRGVRKRDSSDGSGVAKIEATLIERQSKNQWMALAKPAKRLKIGDTIVFSDSLSAHVVARDQARASLQFELSGSQLDAAIIRVGDMPLPPYIAAKRPPDAQDLEDYQTFFASRTGAVAAPTASLHFDQSLMDGLQDAGILSAELTLHVGAGTFLPVTTENIKDHKMHAEWGEISRDTADAINAARAAGGRIIPVGTTALRLLESAAQEGTLHPWVGDTDIFITPGYQFQICNGLMTNFHLPKSTLMMLVSALMGQGRIKEIYAHAIAGRYRFFSYGDASLLMPED